MVTAPVKPTQLASLTDVYGAPQSLWNGGGRVTGTDDPTDAVRPSATPMPDRLADEAVRAVLASLISGAGATFAIDTQDSVRATRLMTQLRVWLLFARKGTGGVSATVAPSFFDDTYPAMLALVAELTKAGLTGAWRPDGVRTMRLGEALHVFVSADHPVQEHTPLPDALLDVVGAHLLSQDWFDTRVTPRAKALGLTKVFSGVPGRVGSVYERARTECLVEQERTGRQRCFPLLGAASGGSDRLVSAIGR